MPIELSNKEVTFDQWKLDNPKTLYAEFQNENEFKITVRYDVSDETKSSINNFAATIPELTLISSTTEKGLATDIYQYHKEVDLDGPKQILDFTGRIIKYEEGGKVINSDRTPIFYSKGDFDDKPKILNSSSYNRLINQFGGNALSFVRAKYSEWIVEKLLTSSLPSALMKSMSFPPIAVYTWEYTGGNCSTYPLGMCVTIIFLVEREQINYYYDPLMDYLLPRTANKNRRVITDL